MLELTPGSVNFNGTPVDFVGTEAALLSNVRSATFVAPVAVNEITIARPAGEPIILSGTVDGVPFTEFTFDDVGKVSNLIVQGGNGAEHLILDHTSGLDPIPGAGIIFNAGGQPADLVDTLEIRGGEFTRVVYNYENASDGLIDLSDRIIRFTGVGPIINTGSSTNLIFDLTPLDDKAELVSSGGGNLSLVSLNGTFESTTFPTPSLRISISGREGNDSVAVGDLSASGFQGELRLFGELGDDRFALAPSRGMDILAEGGGQNDRLGGYRRQSLVFNGGSNVELSDFVIDDFPDGSAAMQIADADTSVRFNRVTLNGSADDLIEITNGTGGTPPTLNLDSTDNTFYLESGGNGVAFVDNRTSPSVQVNLQYNTSRFDTGRNTSRTVRLASDGRTITDVSPQADTHGSMVNNGDGTVTYTPEPNYVGPARFSYQLSDSSTGSVQIGVVPPNQAPTNSVPGAQTINEDTRLTFSRAAGNALSISDLDAAGDQVLVELSVVGGTLNVYSVGQIIVENNETNRVTVVGSVSDINSALDGLLFTPTPDFDETARLTITTNDLGNNGAGGALTDTDTVDIVVRALNDAPVHVLPPAQTIDEDMSLVFSTARGNSVSVVDPDADSNDIEVNLRVSRGRLTLATTAGLSSVTGNGSTAVAMVASVSEINAALNGLVYAPSRNPAVPTHCRSPPTIGAIRAPVKRERPRTRWISSSRRSTIRRSTRFRPRRRRPKRPTWCSPPFAAMPCAWLMWTRAMPTSRSR